jgi:hypothetical protein
MMAVLTPWGENIYTDIIGEKTCVGLVGGGELLSQGNLRAKGRCELSDKIMFLYKLTFMGPCGIVSIF